MMVNVEDMRKFITLYDAGHYRHQRFGQAFCNHFAECFHDSALFYETSRKRAMDFIYKTYITVCDITG